MRVRMLKSVAGYGTFVHGSPRLFSLVAGDRAEIEDEHAAKWIAAGICAAEAEEMPEMKSASPEDAVRLPSENAMKSASKPKPRHRNR